LRFSDVLRLDAGGGWRQLQGLRKVSTLDREERFKELKKKEQFDLYLITIKPAETAGRDISYKGGSYARLDFIATSVQR
jgi:hypothetical protein